MILGVGADIIEIKRMKESLKKEPRLLKRLFTPFELKQAGALSESRKIAYYAKRFSAKEAISKAFGSGIGKHISWLDIEISNNKTGAPLVTLSPKATLFLQKKFKIKRLHIYLSLSDEKKYALAFSILTN